MYDYENTLKRH